MNPRVVQMLLPFMQKLALSPRAEQGIELAQKLEQLAGRMPKPAGPPTSLMPLIQQLPKGEALPGFRMRPSHILSGEPQMINAELRRPGGGARWESSVGMGEEPGELYVHSLSSGASRRADIGVPEMGLEKYSTAITTAAQPNLPLRRMPLPASEKAQRPMRMTEERLPVQGMPSGAGPDLRSKKLAIDDFLRRARGAGYTKLSFSAEPGERPRLYEQLTGYKFKPAGEDDAVSVLSRRLRGGPSTRPSAQLGDDLKAEQAEAALGLSVEEAFEAGFVQEVGPEVFRLTPDGVRAAKNWLGGTGL